MSTQNIIHPSTKIFSPGEPAPRGKKLNSKGWLQEAALRMLLNNLDREVAERPEELVVYVGRGKAARSLPDFYNILKALQELEQDESLLIQSGSAVARIKTWSNAPRVLIANSNLVIDKYPKNLSPNLTYVCRGLANACGMLLWLYSIQHIPINIATSISALIPIFTTILAIYFLKEKMTYKIFGALIIGLMGFLILLKPTSAHSWLGIAAAMLSALMWAIHDIIAKYQSNTDSWAVQAFYTYIVTHTYLTNSETLL